MNMVISSQDPLLDLPLVTTGRVLSCSITLSYNSAVVLISVHFSSRVFVVPHIAGQRDVWRWILEVYNSPLLCELLVGKISIGSITDSWLTKVNHVCVDAH